MEKLIIVESPNKINTISSYLDSSYKVTACVGHITNLAKTGQFGLGIDINTWTPSYVLDKTKKKTIDEIKKLAKQAKTVIIATDADREGEAIGASLVEHLAITDKYQRIKYNEITKTAILEALENPGELNQNLINSQQTRRMLDRIIGFRLTALLKNKIKNPPKNPAAGRVQSFALSLIFDREKEIREFIPEKYFNLEVKINDENGNFFDTIYCNQQNEAKKVNWINSEEELSEIIAEIKENPYLIFKKYSKATRKDPKVIPLKQATIFKKMSQYSSASVSNALQKLYEGYGDYGLISYPRTDSTRLSQTFIEKGKEFIIKNFGPKYFTKSIKGFAGDQDAHEAIRPTNLELSPELAREKYHLGQIEFQIYQLIYQTTIQALMRSPERKITNLTFKTPIKDHIFSYSYSEFTFDGYYKATEKPSLKFKPEFSDIESLISKKFQVDKNFDNSIKSSLHQTKPPAHFRDGTLIEKLDDEKVGRPSTFAISVKKLKDHLYVDSESKSLVLSDFGKIVYENLKIISPEIIDAKFTAQVEEELDLIAQGKQDYKKYLDSMWSKIENTIEKAVEVEKVIMEARTTGEKCTECDADLVYRYNRKTNQRFIGCSSFPNCRFIKVDENAKKVYRFRKRNTKILTNK